MSDTTRTITILMADDDPEESMLCGEAMAEANVAGDLRVVGDGLELMDYLQRRGPYADPKTSPRPDVILLDLNMPKKDGREALSEIKDEPSLRKIPVIVLTGSTEEEDLACSYLTGASSFITKPVTVERMVKIVTTIRRYWSKASKASDGKS